MDVSIWYSFLVHLSITVIIISYFQGVKGSCRSQNAKAAPVTLAGCSRLTASWKRIRELRGFRGLLGNVNGALWLVWLSAAAGMWRENTD